MLPSLADCIKCLQADVGEVGHRQDIHDPPGVIGGLAVECAPDGLAHGAARPVAADHVARP